MRKRRNGDDTHIRYQQIGEVEQDFQFLLPSRPRDIDLPHPLFQILLPKVLYNLDGSYKMPTTSRRETRDKEQPHGQKGKEEENDYALDKIDGACESYERASKSAQGKTETHGRTHARTHDVPPQSNARSSQQGTQ